jgi:hypothetical protein
MSDTPDYKKYKNVDAQTLNEHIRETYGLEMAQKIALLASARALDSADHAGNYAQKLGYPETPGTERGNIQFYILEEKKRIVADLESTGREGIVVKSRLGSSLEELRADVQHSRAEYGKPGRW